MKKLLIYLVALLGLSSAAVTAWAEEHPIRIGVYDTQIPMVFRGAKGELIGFDIDLSKEAMRRMNRPYQHVLFDWKKRDEVLFDKKSIDLVWVSFMITEERAKKYLFSDPYIQVKKIVVVPIKSEIYKLSDLVDKRVATQRGGNSETMIRDMEKRGEIGKAVFYPDIPRALGGMLMGKADAVMFNETSLRYHAKQSSAVLRILDEDLGAFDVAVGTRPGEEQLIEELNRALRSIIDDGTLDKIYDKWFK